MPDNAKKKNREKKNQDPIRLSPSAMSVLRKEKARRMADGSPGPSYGALIDELVARAGAFDNVIQDQASTTGSTTSETSSTQSAYNPAIQSLLDKIAVDPKRLEAIEIMLRDVAAAALEPHGIGAMPEVIEIKAGSTRQKLDDCLRRIKELADQGRPGAAYFAQGDDPGTPARGGKGAKNRR